MGFVLNPFTGQLDKVKIPLKSGTAQPGSTGPNGDIEVDLVSSQGNLYFRTGGNLYKLQGTAVTIGNVDINLGQPIPVGMGLTFTYAQNLT